MNWDDEYDNMDYSSHRDSPMPDKSSEGGLDPMDMKDMGVRPTQFTESRKNRLAELFRNKNRLPC